MRRLASPIALVVLLALAPAAQAGTADVVSGQLTYVAKTTEVNVLTVAPSICGSVAAIPCFVITDSAGVTPAGSNCSRVSATQATCPSNGVSSYSIVLDDQDDTAALSIPIPGTLDGGDGNDRLGGGTGADVFVGGPGADTADWSGRSQPVSASIDGAANDGEAGEGDNVGTDVENLTGGAGNDTLTGSAAVNALSGGDGNDSITARDTSADAVACGNGTDSAVVDATDTVSDCETVDAGVMPPPPPPPPPPPGEPPPVLGKSFNIEPVSGDVFVILPPGTASARAAKSRRHRLRDLENIPLGSQVDTRKGVAKLTSARDRAGKTQSASFSRGLFSVKQANRSGAYTDLTLVGGSFRSCRTKKARSSASRPRRRLFGNGKGRFRTKGRFSSATVRGTEWGVRDLCEGTLTRVQRGTVRVRDFKRHRTITLRTGQTYLAKASSR